MHNSCAQGTLGNTRLPRGPRVTVIALRSLSQKASRTDGVAHEDQGGATGDEQVIPEQCHL